MPNPRHQDDIVDGRHMETDEHRVEPRRRVLLPGKVLLPNGGAIDCTIRNRSPHGARLAVASVIGIPDAFELLIESTAETLRVEIAWRKAGEIGLHVVDE
jgi:hypothetical protein